MSLASLRIEPPPGLLRDDQIARQRICRSICLCVVARRVKTQKLGQTLGPEHAPGRSTELSCRAMRQGEGAEGILLDVVPPGQERNMHLLAPDVPGGRNLGHDITVDIRREHRHHRIHSEVPWRGGVQRLGRHGAQLRDRASPELRREPHPARVRLREALHGTIRAVPERAALADRLLEQPLGQRGGHQDADRVCTRRLAEQGDVGGVAPKTCDVGFDPAQRRKLILQAVIARWPFTIEIGMGEVAEHAKPVVERHHHRALPGQHCAIDRRIGGRAELEAAAMHPHHHRAFLRGGLRPRPDV